MNLGIGLGVATSYLPIPAVALDPDAAIAALFQTGTPGVYYEGAWYDPSDSTTVFQDAAGTTAATVGDPVGLILDKSKGLTLGSELVTNGASGFSGTSGWTSLSGGTVAEVSGQLVLTCLNGDNAGGGYYSFSADAGKTYQITYVVASVDDAFRAYVQNPANPPDDVLISPSTTTTASGTYTARVKATSTGSRLFSVYSVNQDAVGDEAVVLSSVTIKELPGNHATQTTSAARPVLQSSGGLYYLDFDGVDDKLQTASVVTIPTSPDLTASIAFRRNTLSAAYNTIFSVGGYTSGGIILQSVNQSATAYLERLARNGNTFADSTTVNTTGTDHVWTIENSSSGVSARMDQAVEITSATVTNITSHYWTIGSRTDSIQYCDAHVYAFVGVNRTLAAGEISDLESWLATKSGVTL